MTNSDWPETKGAGGQIIFWRSRVKKKRSIIIISRQRKAGLLWPMQQFSTTPLITSPLYH